MPFALITGASRGLGKAFAESLAKRKHDLLLVARNEKLLAELSNELHKKYAVKTFYKTADLSLPQSVDEIVAWCKNEDFDINILINNAGYGLHGAFEDISLAEQLNMMNLNMDGYVRMTYMFLPLLKQHKGKSYLMDIASTAAYQAVPFLTTYSATKAFVVSFTRGLRQELKGSNISVTCLSPGGVDTNFMERAGMNKVGKIVKQADKFNMTAEDVAEFGVNAMFAGKAEVIPGFANKIGVYSNRLLPKNLVEGVAKGIYNPGK